VSWTVLFHPAFDTEFKDLSEAVQDELLAHATLLEQFGPTLGRPRVDTLNGSTHANMKELRFDADGASGAWLSRSIRGDVRSCWSRATSLVEARTASTGSFCERQISALTSTSKT
jgi:Phage derived protein Gp49-like (DUF891)